jgi:Domain of unknown function (DUF4440)
MKTSEAEEELLKVEKEFAETIVKNDLAHLTGLVADDWVVIDPNGEVIERARFFEVIKSGSLTHETMESEDLRIPRLWRQCSGYRSNPHQGEIHGTGVQYAGTGHRCVCETQRAMALRDYPSHPIAEEMRRRGFAMPTRVYSRYTNCAGRFCGNC